MKRTHLPILELLLVFLAGCATAPSLAPLTCPQRGGRAWTEVSSAHIRLRTDLPADEARRTAEELEQSYDALDQIFRADLPDAPPLPDEPVRVTMFHDAADMAELFPRFRNGGFFNGEGNDWEPTLNLVMSGSLDDHGRVLLRHEMTHRLVLHYLPTAPAWLNEGLAKVYSTVSVTAAGARIGGWHDDLYHGGFQPDVRELFLADEGQFLDQPGYYTEAHALTHLLSSERRDYRPRFLTYLRQLAAGVRADLAWRLAFPALDLDALERSVNGYRFIVLRTDLRTVPVVVKPPQVTARPMSDADVHVLWAELRPWSSPVNRANVEQDLAQAGRQEPQSPRYLYWNARYEWSKRGVAADPQVERALAADPNDAALILAHARAGNAEAASRLREAARTPLQLSWLVWHGHVEDPVALAQRMVALAPAQADRWITLAQQQQHAGRLAEAAVSFQRAAWLRPEYGALLLELRAAILRARAAGVALPAPPFGELAPPPGKRYGVTVTGRLIDGNGHAVAGWVLGVSRGKLDQVRTNGEGGFSLQVPPGDLYLTALPDEGKTLGDWWRNRLRPSPKPVDVGVLQVVEGELPLEPAVFDGIEAQSVDGRTVVYIVGADSPAGRAGVRVGDELLEIDGQSVAHLGNQGVDARLLGAVGAEKTVTVARPGVKPLSLRFQLAAPQN